MGLLYTHYIIPAAIDFQPDFAAIERALGVLAAGEWIDASKGYGAFFVDASTKTARRNECLPMGTVRADRVAEDLASKIKKPSLLDLVVPDPPKADLGDERHFAALAPGHANIVRLKLIPEPLAVVPFGDLSQDVPIVCPKCGEEAAVSDGDARLQLLFERTTGFRRALLEKCGSCGARLDAAKLSVKGSNALDGKPLALKAPFAHFAIELQVPRLSYETKNGIAELPAATHKNLEKALGCKLRSLGAYG